MDIFAHAVYGATVCSRTGLAGGRDGSGKRTWLADKTVWWAMGWGLFPDVAAMGVPFVVSMAKDPARNFFVDIGPGTMAVYHTTHSLIAAGIVLALLWRFWRAGFVAGLAWPLHVVMDAATHGVGTWQTWPLFPLTDWGINGVNWWEHPGLIQAYWLALPVTWLVVLVWRRGARRARLSGSGRAELGPAP